MGFFSSVFNTAANVGMSFLSQKANKKEAARQRDWQTEMSNTAHQREVADLRAAGLNPVLSATGGSGASTGSSGLADMSLGHPFSLDEDPYEYQQRMKQVASARENVEADTDLKKANTYLDVAKQATERWLAATSKEQLEMYREQARIARTQANIQERKNQWEREHPDWYHAQQIADIVFGGASALSSMGNLGLGVAGYRRSGLPTFMNREVVHPNGGRTFEHITHGLR